MAVIQNFGFMWERNKIDWASKGPGGGAKLTGVKVGALKKEVNFKGQMGIYVLYDKFEQPVQVGQSEDILERLKQHRRDHLRNRWTTFTWFGFYKVGKKNELLTCERSKTTNRTTKLGASLNEIEAVLIQVLEPRLNRRGANWKAGIKGDGDNGADEYLQIDETAKDDDLDKLSEQE